MTNLLPRSAAVLLLCASFAVAGTPGDAHRESFPVLPPDAEVLYLPDKYAACLRCHPKEMIEEEDFNVATNFRDTTLGKNLHGLHVYRQPKGTNCKACHEVARESGSISFLPEAKVTITESGGRCTPSCHRPKAYANAGRSR